ncbi:8320_t:CDS:2 [Ambispora gerdemannii]|uniref:8320_t:CDS:1 n=1 Tax=Ambispora gerdemannii TaxID=144530 RepID=A0A9N8V9R6_9GLOM|nr:8320_t:CDS:2 [Ambispora gerdemannii]
MPQVVILPRPPVPEISVLKVGECRPRRAISSDVEDFCSLTVRDYRVLSPDYNQEEIERNLNTLRSKLEHPTTGADVNLCSSLKQTQARVSILQILRDPEASVVLSDDSDIVKNLGRHPVAAECNEFVENFNNSNTSRVMRNIYHDKKWKYESELLKVTERILGTPMLKYGKILHLQLVHLAVNRVKEPERQSIASETRSEVSSSSAR